MKRLSHAVAQEDAMGCGIACVAFVMGLTYRNTRSKYFGGKCNSYGYYFGQLRRALASRGIKYTASKSVLGKRSFENGTIVFVKRSRRFPAGHFMVKTKNGWMNPWINHPDVRKVRAGFNRILPGTAQWAIFPVL